MKTPTPTTPNRSDILSDAIEKITGSRQIAYGDPHASHELIAALWTNYLSVHAQGPLLPHDVAVMCVLQKVARIALNPTHTDNYVDIGGYAGIAGELAPRPTQQDLPMSSDGAGSADPDLQPCKSNEGPTRPLDAQEQMHASRIGHAMLGQTLKPFSQGQLALAMDAILRPTTLTLRNFRDLREAINTK